MTDASARKRARAVFFSAIMVISMVAVGVGGFAGSAAAANTINVSDSSELTSAVGGENPTASPGDTIVITSNINLDSDVFVEVENVTIEGQSGDETVTRVSDGSDKVFRINADDVTLRDLEVVRSANASNRDDTSDFAHAIVIRDRNGGEISGVTVDNVDIVGEGFSTDPNNRGLQVLDGTGSNAADASDVTVTDSSVSGFAGGFSAAAAYGGTVSNVDFVDNDNIEGESVGVEASTYGAFGNPGGTLDDVTVDGNDFGTFSDDASPVVELAETDGDTIDVLDFEEVFEDNEFERSAVALNDGAVRTFEISHGGGTAVAGAITANISGSVNAAEDGDTINVSSGIYNETVSINTNNITLRGPNAGIDAARDDRNQEANITKTVAISSNNVTVDGFTISNTEGEFNREVLKTAVKVGRDDERNNGNEIRNNIIRDAKYGLLEFKAFGLTIEDNLFTTSVDTAGIATFYTTADLEIINNTFNTGDIDVSLGDTSGDVEADVSGNQFYGGGEFGVTVVGYAEANITENDFINTDKAIRVPSDAEEYTVSVRRNNLSGAETGVYNKGPIPVDATDNWWGSESGPTDGAVVGDVTVNPWLNAPTGEPRIAATVGGENFSSIQSAVDAADDGDTVNIEAGTFNESISIDGTNLSIDGAGADADGTRIISEGNGIDFGVDDYDGVRVSNLSIDAADQGIRFVAPGGQNVVENVTVRDTQIDAGSSGVAFFNSQTRNAEIVRNEITAEIVGIQFTRNDGHENVSVTDNNVSSSDTALTLRNVGGAVVENNTFVGEGPAAVTVENANEVGFAFNEFADSAIGLEIEGTDNGVTANLNTFVNNDADIVSTDEDPSEIDAVLNYYGEDRAPTVEGSIIYDPVLTVPVDDVGADSVEDLDQGAVEAIREYGSVLELESDGDALAVGFSAPPNETVGKVFADLEGVEGNLFVYDGEGYESVDADYTPSTGEVVVITNDGVDEDVVVPVDTGVGDTAALPTDIDVENGWNLVATGAAAGIDEIDENAALNGVGTINDAQQLQAQPEQPGAPDFRFGAYEATWLFVDGSGEIKTGYAQDQNPREYIEEILLPEPGAPSEDVDDEDDSF